MARSFSGLVQLEICRRAFVDINIRDGGMQNSHLCPYPRQLLLCSVSFHDDLVEAFGMKSKFKVCGPRRHNRTAISHTSQPMQYSM
jgi:hypothetical protein